MKIPNSEVWMIKKISPDGRFVDLLVPERPSNYRRGVRVAELDGQIPNLLMNDSGTITPDGKFLLLGQELNYHAPA